MATIFKRGGDNAPKDEKWIVSWFNYEIDKWRQKTAYTDKDLSMALGLRLERESASRREGFSSSVREESIAPIEDAIEEFLTHLKTKKRDANYMQQVEQRIRRLLEETNAKRLIDINVGKIESALLKLRSKRGFEGKGKLLSITTRNEYVSSMTMFTKWAKTRRKLEFDPLESLSKAEKTEDDRVHPRRAISADEVSRLLHAARERPVIELITIRTGKDKGKLKAKVRDWVLNRETITGINRRMAYLLAIWTGLRRKELGLLQWKDVHLEVEVPSIRLRAVTTKAKRADMLALHEQVAAELLAWRPKDFQPHDRVLPEVPSMAVLKRDLAFAGIEYGSQKDGFADLHSMRMTLNTMLASQKVGSRIRQTQLRHVDPKLTENTYFDLEQFLLPQSEELNKAAAIVVPMPPSDENMEGLVTQNVHETGGTEGRSMAQHGTQASNENVNDEGLAGGSLDFNLLFKRLLALNGTTRRLVTPGRNRSG